MTLRGKSLVIAMCIGQVVVTGFGLLAMLATCAVLAPVRPRPIARPLLDFAPVLRNRAALGYVLAVEAASHAACAKQSVTNICADRIDLRQNCRANLC